MSMKRIHSFSIVLIILLIMSGFVTAAMNNSPEYPVIQANRSSVPPDAPGAAMIGAPARIDQKTMGVSSGPGQPDPDQTVMTQENLLIKPGSAENLGGGGGYLPAIGWNKYCLNIYCFNIVTPYQSIKQDTHPAVISRKPGTVDIIYYHPDGSIWWSNRTGGRASDPLWSPGQQINSWTGTMFSPGVYSFGPNQFTVMETDTSHNIWNAVWGEGVGILTWTSLVSNNEVNSTPAALVRHGGNDFDLVYFNVSNYLIHRNYNYTRGTWTRHAVFKANRPINDGISLVSTSPDSFTIIFGNGNLYAISKVDTSDEFGIWYFSYSNVPVYSYVTASTRKYNDSQIQATIIDVVYNKYSTWDYYWSHSDDLGYALKTWKNETFLFPQFVSPISVISPRYNRIEMYQAETALNFTAVMGYKGPDHTKIGVFRPITHTFYLKNGTKTISVNWGVNTDIPVTGDWNGDGTTEVGVFRNSTHSFYLRNHGLSTTVINWGGSTDIPVTGDWNGDAVTEVGVFRPSAHTFYLKNGTATTLINWGAGTDLPVTGDWNGDGRTEVGVFRPSAHTFYLKNGTATTSINWGAGTDLPVTGDWNMDGITDVGVYRPSAHTFYLRNYGLPTTVINWGISTDKPVSGEWT